MSEAGEHHFEITVRMWGHDAPDLAHTLITQEIRAWNLPDALQVAAAVPLWHWFPDEEEDS